MAEKETAIPILTTKLHRPPVAADHLHRRHLLDRPKKNIQRPLTLVSAAAGYGKTTLISCWPDLKRYASYSAVRTFCLENTSAMCLETAAAGGIHGP